MWDWVPWGWLQSDLASWLAVVIAIMAILFALRKHKYHTELRFTSLKIKEEQISLEVVMSTYSHAPRIDAKAEIKIDGISYPMSLEPIKAPTNFRFAVLNNFQICFTGKYVNTDTLPQSATVDVKVKLSDGSKAKLHEIVTLCVEDNPNN